MKKIIIACLFCSIILILPLCSYSGGLDMKVPVTEQLRYSLTSGGYMFFEYTNEVYFLIDTRTGRLWKLGGSIQEPEYFAPIKYEVSKGNLTSQPESDPTKGFPGRFQFNAIVLKLRSDIFVILDTVTGNMWSLQGTAAEPKKMTLIPRKD